MLWYLALACLKKTPVEDAQLLGEHIKLTPIATGLAGITDIRFRKNRMVTSLQSGQLVWVDDNGATHPWFTLNEVVAGGEKGLLSFAFDPNYDTNGRLILSWTAEKNGALVSRVGSFHTTPGALPGSAPLTQRALILEVPQPFSNHNGGCVQFGPDGMLYVGLGDGGNAGDPFGSGQDRSSVLGSILRFDLSQPAPHAPRDNPFTRDPTTSPLIWAYGLRNPWRFSFSPHGQFVVADVGQNRHEEIGFAVRGANLGWNIKEGDACYQRESCKGSFIDPIWTYPRSEGISVTGGYVATAGPLQNRYVFGDFGSGKIWALRLPQVGEVATPVLVGEFPINPSTFGINEEGHVFVADYAHQTIYRIDPSAPPAR